MVKQLPFFTEAIEMVELLDEGKFKEPVIAKAAELPDAEKNPDRFEPELNIPEVYRAIVLGIRDYFTKMNFKKAIIGSSGGIDSAVTIAIACEALGKENVRAVLMPSQYSTGHSVSDAEQLKYRF